MSDRSPDINLKGEKRPQKWLPNGEINPEFWRWRYHTESQTKHRNSGRYKEVSKRCVDAYRGSLRGKKMRCRNAKSINDKTRAVATLVSKPWDLVDEVYLLEHADKLKLRDIAVTLGRSHAAVNAKLVRLRKDEGVLP